MGFVLPSPEKSLGSASSLGRSQTESVEVRLDGGVTLTRRLFQTLPVEDLVLSDIAMPGRDGYAVLSEVRRVETALGRRVPVAAVSAYAHAEDRQRAIAAGFDRYLAKPVDPAALASTVKTLVAIGNRRLAEPH